MEAYVASHPGSAELHERAKKLFTGNGATHRIRMLDPFRPYITHAKGSRKWDVDGNEYIDYMMGHGALILGHSHPDIVQAVQDQVAKGLHYGENHELEVQWAELIQRMMPMAERVEFCACGQEANMMAIRLARIFTGRKKVLRLEENFHGWADELVHQGSAGVPGDQVTVIPFNDVNRLEQALATGEYAIVLTEGGGAHLAGRIPIEDELLYALPDLTKKYDTLWLIDEVVTGFRDAPGGWQSTKGVTPDLTSLGKCTGGGIPVGAVVGRRDVMSAFDPTNPPDRIIAHSGTWNANPVQCAAGVAACNLYLDGSPQRVARERGDQLRHQGNRVLREQGISGRLYGRTIIHLYLGEMDYEPADDTLPPTKDPQKIMGASMGPVRARLTLNLLQRGVAVINGEAFVMSQAHTEQDVARTVEAFSASLEAMKREGSLAESVLV
jgi:glutamate-1-semialdehyde 2,1-aminomutase